MTLAATIRVELDRIAPVRVDVELPTSCPHCRLSFEGADSLIEEAYCATNQPCSIAEADGQAVVDGYAATESVYDVGLLVGYQCGGCRRSLVSIEGARGEGT
jgi:hypothetical protein